MNQYPDPYEREIERTGDAIRANAGFLVLFALGVLHLLKLVTFDWPAIVVFCIALLPQISRLVDYLKAGKEGVEMKMGAGSKPANEVENASKAPTPEPSEFATLPDEQKRIIKSLWHFQKAHYGMDSPTRWGFVVGPGAPDYYVFVSGAAALESRGVISSGGKGLIFLTNRGIEFCSKHQQEIDTYPLHYQIFTNA